MGDGTDKNIIVAGSWGAVAYAICANGSCPARDFLGGLSELEKQKVGRLFLAMAETGSIRNPQKFKKEEGEIFGFKCHQIRIGCFQVGRKWYLTHGFRKKKDNWPKSELERAERIRAEHGT